MSMPRTAMDWTAERVRALPDDGKRYEVVDGELLVTPSPRTPHQRALGELHFRLTEYVRATGIGEVFFSPSDVEFDPRTLVQPDLFVVPFNEGRRIRNWSEIRQPTIARSGMSGVSTDSKNRSRGMSPAPCIACAWATSTRKASRVSLRIRPSSS